jgi:hypothetical protein
MPLSAGRNTQVWAGELREQPAGAGTRIFKGALVMRNAAGFVVRGAAATGATGVGMAEVDVDNTAGANGAKTVRYSAGVVARFLNSSAGDLIAQADVGLVCWIADDDRVAKTNGGGTRSRAGIVEAVDAQGVWVRLDEALTRAS